MARDYRNLPKKLVKSALSGLSGTMKVQAVMDGFRNVATGIGTSRSKTAYGEYVRDPLLTYDTLEGLFESHDLAAVIVSKVVEDALRGGFRLEFEGGDPEEDKDELEEIHALWSELELTPAVARGGTFGRLKGGAGLILLTKGGGDPSTELLDEDITELVGFQEWDAEDMTEYTWYPDGSCETYQWTPTPRGKGMGPSTQVVHESRLLVFPGAMTTARGRRLNRGWDHSVLQRVYGALRSFDSMFGSTDAMFADASQAVFKLQGLIQTLAEANGTGQADVQTRLQLMDLLRSSSKAIVLDAGDETGRGGEEFEVVDRSSLGGLDQVMQVYLIRLAAAARMPLTVLLGMSPAGMDATGESDMILYFNTVDIYRLNVLAPRVLRLCRILARQAGVADEKIDKLKICWPELARPKPLDVRTAENMAVTSAVELINAQVIVPEEVAMSLDKLVREGVGGITIDVTSRKKRLKDALTELEDGELGLGQETALIEAKGEATAKSRAAGVPATKKSERKTPSKAAKKQV